MQAPEASSTTAVRITRPDLDLSELRRSFVDIPRDPYLTVGVRHRTQTRYRIEPDRLVALERVQLFQSTDINPLQQYGGIKREYPDLPGWLQTSSAFRALVDHWLSLVPVPVGEFSAHQIRTVGDGMPVPEGRHRDGYEYVAVFVVERHAIRDGCARTTVWDAATDEPVLQDVVLHDGEMVSFDDRLVLHDVTPLVPSGAVAKAYRDVIILTYPDHSKTLRHGKVVNGAGEAPA
ncbi:MAG TPA: 2OG-Fe dioxygenase family protein [Kineosporiaceae bacterium]